MSMLAYIFLHVTLGYDPGMSTFGWVIMTGSCYVCSGWATYWEAFKTGREYGYLQRVLDEESRGERHLKRAAAEITQLKQKLATYDR